MGWPLPDGLREEELESKLFGNQPVVVRAVQRPQPDWKAIHEQLQQHRHLTLQLLWQDIGKLIPRAIATVGSVSATSTGGGTWTWCCGKNTRRGVSRTFLPLRLEIIGWFLRFQPLSLEEAPS